MNKILTFNVAEATELGTHCALHHSYSPQEQKYIFRLDVYNQKQIKMAISQNEQFSQEQELFRFVGHGWTIEY